MGSPSPDPFGIVEARLVEHGDLVFVRQRGVIARTGVVDRVFALDQGGLLFEFDDGTRAIATLAEHVGVVKRYGIIDPPPEDGE